MSENEYAISLGKANLVSLFLLIPLTVLSLGPYIAIWGWGKVAGELSLIYDHYFLFLLLIILGIVAHELIHGLTWMKAGNKSLSAMKFGFNWKGLAPYAHCRESLEIQAYRTGAVMPGIVLGIIPFFIGCLTGSGWFMLFGYLFIITAAGDLLILWLVRDIEPGTHVQDHPEKAGCTVVDT